MQKDKQFYDRFFTNYPLEIHDSVPRFLAVASLLKGKVLDVACGTGTLSKYFSGDYCGVDISDVAIAKAKKRRRQDARFYQADFTKDAFVSKEKFDCAYLGEFLEHIENDGFVFNNLADVLVPNGRIIVSVPNGDRVPDESHCRIFTVASIRRDYSKYGKIKFHTWEGFHDRILFSIELGNAEPEEISLVMIVKNEQKGIEKAITSVLEFVDKVIVSVDSGTIDKTKEIAEMYADEVRVHEWKNDFSQARNEADENVSTKWILFLDGHEYVESVGNVREKMKQDIDGIFVTVRLENNMTFLYPRIYRNGLKFKNAVHNLVETPRKTAETGFVIVHDRDNLQDAEASERRNKQRQEMLPAFMKKQIAENPENARAHFHLANYYMMIPDLKGAIKHYKKVVKFSYMHDEVYMAYLSIGRIHFGLGHNLRALWFFNKADALIPDRWETHRVLGGFYFMQQHWQKAVEHLIDALGQNKRHYTYEPMAQNLPEIWDMIGHCFEKLDQPEKTVVAWERAMELSETPKQKAFFMEKLKLAKLLVSDGKESQVKIPVEDRNDAQ